jgi:hypothetical protein
VFGNSCGYQRGVSCDFSEHEREECCAIVKGYREECHVIVLSTRDRDTVERSLLQ